MADCLEGIKVDNSRIKEETRQEFGIMSEKSVNNAIASWVVLYNKSVSDRNLAKKALEPRNKKYCLMFWENKSHCLSNVRTDIPVSDDANAVIASARSELNNQVQATLSVITKSRVSVSNINATLHDLRKTAADIRKRLHTIRDPQAEKLALLKMSCEVLEAQNADVVLSTVYSARSDDVSDMKIVGNLIRGAAMLTALLPVLSFGLLAVMNVSGPFSVPLIVVTLCSLMLYLLSKVLNRAGKKADKKTSVVVLLGNKSE